MTMPAATMPTGRLREILAPFAEYSARSGGPTLTVSRGDLDGAALRSWPVENGKYEQRSERRLWSRSRRCSRRPRRSALATTASWSTSTWTHASPWGTTIALAHPDKFAPLVGVGLNARIASQPAGDAARARSATTITASRRGSAPLYLLETRPAAKRSLRAADEIPVVLREVPGPVTVSVSEQRVRGDQGGVPPLR